MNQAAEMRIFGSRGRTEGYVDAEGKPLTQPIPGRVDEIRGISQADEIRKNPRYGTKQSDRHAAADAYEAQFKAGQAERDARADGYVESLDELQADGYELSQAELINDLAGEVGAKQHAMLDKLVSQAAGGRTLSPEEDQKIRGEAINRIVNQTIRQGNDVGMLMRMIKEEGLFNREEYEKFRYKRGNPENGERKEFTAYREQSIANHKNFRDATDRNALIGDLNAKTILRAQRRAQKAGAEADAAKRREEEAKTARLPITDPSPKGLRARARHLMALAAVSINDKAERLGNWFGDKEKGNKRKAAAIVAGAVVIAGVTYLELKTGGSSGGSHGHEATLVPPVKPQHHEAAQHAQSITHTGNGGTTAPEHAQPSTNGGTTAPNAGKPGVTELRSGQNPWTVSETRLHELGNAHPSAAQIEHFDKAMAQANPDVYSYAGDSSEQIPAGTELKLPR
jgi:hypothetical protein